MNEKLSITASGKVVGRLKSQLKKEELQRGSESSAKIPFPVRIVELTQKYWSQFDPLARGQGIGAMAQSQWMLPVGLDMGSWRQFHKEADSSELLAVIWSQINGFSDCDIAQGLNVTEGTVRHRVARGVRRLGSMYKLDALDD